MSRSKSVLERANLLVRKPSLLVSFSYSKWRNANVPQSTKRMSGIYAVPGCWKCLVNCGGHLRKNLNSISGPMFRNTQIKSERHLSCCSTPAYQRSNNGSDNSDEHQKEKPGNEQTLARLTEQNIKVYDPKQDSFFTQDIAYGSKENKGGGEAERPVFIPEDENTGGDNEDLLPPTNCCMSGCPNCVWIDYVEKLSKKYTEPTMSREKILKELDELDDQNIKAFIMMELRTRKLI